MDISNIPNESLLNIFYNLDHDDLYAVSSVCKRWRDVCNEECLWKKLCLNYIDCLESTYQSYKKRFHVIDNMLGCKYSTILYHDNNHADEIILSKKGDILKLSIDSIVGNKILINNISSKTPLFIIDNDIDDLSNEYFTLDNMEGGSKIISTYSSDNNFILLDSVGTIHIYENDTFLPLNIIKTNHIISSDIDKPRLYYNESFNEIIIFIQNKINIINAIESNLNISLDVNTIINAPFDYSIIKSTQNYIIFQINNYTSPEKTFLINKNTLKMSLLFDQRQNLSLSIDCHDFDTYNNYLAVVTFEHKINIYIDQNNDINFNREIYLSHSDPGLYPPTLKINNALLYVSHEKQLHILKIKTGEKISTINHDYIVPTIITNGYHLLILGIKGNSLLYDSNSYTLYDYTSYSSTMFNYSIMNICTKQRLISLCLIL